MVVCTVVRWSFLAALGVVAACQSGQPTPSTSPATASSQGGPAAEQAQGSTGAGPRKFGAALTSAPFVALPALAKEAPRYADRRIQTEGVVRAVCQARGCWMEISDGEGDAHVKIAGHRFSIPRDASGRRAKVEATVVGTPAQGECEREAAEATGKLTKLQLEAIGVELL